MENKFKSIRSQIRDAAEKEVSDFLIKLKDEDTLDSAYNQLRSPLIIQIWNTMLYPTYLYFIKE